MLEVRMNSMVDFLQDLARSGARELTPEAAERITGFILKNRQSDGGFQGRSGQSDLYYTHFALESLIALEYPLAGLRMEEYLARFGAGDSLDLVHLACLIRCWGRLTGIPARCRRQWRWRLRTFWLLAGAGRPKTAEGLISAYQAFLLALASEAAELPAPPEALIRRGLHRWQAGDGGYANLPGVATGTTTVTAAVAILLAMLQDRTVEPLAAWLADRYSPMGGFSPSSRGGAPDLLSTATALVALRAMGADWPDRREDLLNFIDILWDESGGFGGSLGDPRPDVEYTYYGLLALGALAEEE